MKTLIRLIFLGGIGLLVSCSEKHSEPDGVYSTVTVPFVARYTGYNQFALNSTSSQCGSEYQRIIENANGKASIAGFSYLSRPTTKSNLKLIGSCTAHTFLWVRSTSVALLFVSSVFLTSSQARGSCMVAIV